MSNQRPIDPAVRLKLARESKGLSPKQVAETTKLSVRTIEALESNRLSVLPSGIYRRSIIRAVAVEVGLDPVQLLREFSIANPNELPPVADVEMADSRAPMRESLQRAMAIVGTIVPLVAGIGYFAMSERPAPARPVAAPVRASDAWRPEIVPAGGFLEPPPPVQRAVVMTLTVSSRCQLRVNADGREIVGRTVDAGETFQVALTDEVLLSGDNASAVQFSVNGQAGIQLGVSGEPLSIRIGRDDYEAFLVRH
ncbi:MAG: helix-turn-helix domain-containing protein [Vicinamibacterales bacterium]